nr:MAG TPA: hypothetical protein [Siphoviridae sp. cty4Z2]
MLTKEERAAIAERANRAKYSMDSIFEILHGYSSPEYMSLKDDFIAMVTRVLDLCDTSNMVELPVDKDGEVIRIGDTVYDCECTKYEVVGHSSSSNVLLSAGRELICFKKPANELTHKEPVTVKLLAQHIKRVLGDEATSIGVVPYIELRRIAKQLESLGDSDDD